MALLNWTTVLEKWPKDGIKAVLSLTFLIWVFSPCFTCGLQVRLWLLVSLGMSWGVSHWSVWTPGSAPLFAVSSMPVENSQTESHSLAEKHLLTYLKKKKAKTGVCIFGNLTYQTLLLQQWSVPIKHKDWPDAEEEQLTDAVEECEEVGVLDTVTITVPYPLYCLVQPYTDVWGRGLVKGYAVAIQARCKQ